jgi:4-phytase/acid phosphatase
LCHPRTRLHCRAMRPWLPLLIVAMGISTAAAQAAAPAPESDLTFVFILSRHGVRSPLLKNEEMAQFAAQPWPEWNVPVGILTPHGRQVMELMGAYYRAYYTAEGLLSGDPARDGPRIFFRSNASERTIATAQALGAGLLPGRTVVVHALPMTNEHSGDPLLDPDTALDRGNSGLKAAALLGRIGGSYGPLLEENRPALESLERVLLGGDGQPPPGKVSLLSLDPEGPLWGTAQRLVDAVTLEYADGMPLPEVGWGRFRPDNMVQLMSLSSLNFDLTWRSSYRAQAAASNLASHIVATLEQAAAGKAVEGALGAPGDQLAVVVGHDSNLVPLGGVLGVEWRVPGASFNPVLPGGAMIFELRRLRKDGRFLVRTRYVAPTLAQTRAAIPFTPENPPAAAAIFVPGCSLATPGYDAPLEAFAAHVRAAIDPKLIQPEPAAVR